MTKKVTLSLLAACLTFMSFAQDTIVGADVPDSLKYWKVKTIFGLNGTQSSFVNWNAGGRTNISAIGLFSFTANYEKDSWKWSNDLTLALGGIKYTDRSGIQKTDDKIEYATSAGYEFKKHWFFSLVGNFRTQFLDGFSYPNDSIRTSTFMAPGYLNLALGVEYSPNDNLSVFLSPLSTKLTFVQDEVLANAGSFGVDGATYDALGNVVTPGKMLRQEYGAYFRMMYSRNLMENISMKSKLELFSNYVENPQNIDVNAELLMNFKINKWFSASLQWNLIYDDDIDITDAQGRTGPRTQFKSVLGLGISYSLQNFKDED